MNKTDFIKVIREEVRKVILNEENSINGDVDEEAYNVYKIILSHQFSKNEKLKDANYGCDVYQFSFNRNFQSCNILYTIKFFDYRDGVAHNLDSGSVVLSKTSAFININYDLECGSLSRGDLHDSIQHELTHVLKGIKVYDKNRNYEPKALSVIQIADAFYNSKDEYEKAIGCVFYMGLNDEQDAYINGLYAQIKNNLHNGALPRHFIKQTPFYQKVGEIKSIKNNIDSYFSNENFLCAVERFKRQSKYKKPITKDLLINKINYIWQ
jgi:hypothetical protein